MNEQWIDKTKPIREGEDFNLDNLLKYIRNNIHGLKGEARIEQFPSGHSNLTYLLRVGDRELVIRRPPFGRKAKSAHDMKREYEVLKALKPVFPYCPAPLAYADDDDIIGSPFYVMERIRGVILRRDLPKGLDLSREDARKLCEKLIDVHLELHALDYRSIGLEGFGKPDGYVKRQVSGWSERYRAARTSDAPDFEAVMTWLEECLPPECGAAVIHNDYRLDNVVLDPSDPMKIIGVLDWEMATIGDPLMDLGGSLAYWVDRTDPAEMQAIRLVPTHLDGMFSRREVVRYYADRKGIKVDNFDFYYVFGLFRLAVIAQQIYFRFFHGQTKDERFGQLIFAIHVLEKQAKVVMEQTNS